MNFPQRIGGAKAIYSWLNRLLAACFASKVVESRDIMPTRTPSGTVLFIKNIGGGSGQYHDFKLCRNGQQITVEIDSKQDPATVEDDEIE